MIKCEICPISDHCSVRARAGTWGVYPNGCPLLHMVREQERIDKALKAIEETIKQRNRKKNKG